MQTSETIEARLDRLERAVHALISHGYEIARDPAVEKLLADLHARPERATPIDRSEP